MPDALASEQTTMIEEGIVLSPFGRLLGLGVEEVATDRVRVRLPYRSDVTTLGEMVHGGAIASLVDVSATAAGWATPDVTAGARGTTVGFSISYLAPGLGQDLLATASVVRRGGSLCVIEVDVVDVDGGAVARALVTYKLSRPKGD